MLSRAQPSMIADLISIWHQCYGDSEEYIRFFMTHRFKPQDTLVWLEGERAVGAAYLMPCHIGDAPGFYCYAVGVLPAYRGRGISSALLTEVERYTMASGRFLIGSPRDGTIDYYHSRGVHDAFFCRWVDFSAHGHTAPIFPVEAESGKYMRLRNAHFPPAGLVRWDEDAIAYALAEHRLCGGFAQFLPWQGTDYLLLGRIEEDNLVLLETTLPEPLLTQLAPSLCAHYGGKHLRCRLPGTKQDTQTGVCSGTITWTAGWFTFDLS